MSDRPLQQMFDEIDKICEKYGLQLINISLRDPNKNDGEPDAYMVINRLTMDDFLKMSEGEVKH